MNIIYQFCHEDNQAQCVDVSQDFEDEDDNINSDSSSIDKNIVDLFALLELQNNVEKLDAKVDIFTSKVVCLDSNLI